MKFLSSDVLAEGWEHMPAPAPVAGGRGHTHPLYSSVSYGPEGPQCVRI